MGTGVDPQVDQERRQLQSTVRIAEVRPLRMLAELVADAPSAGAKVHLDVSARISVEPGAAGILAVFHFDVGLASAEAEPPFVRFEYSLLVGYELDQSPRDEVVTRFVETNGMIHAYPFLRAFVHQACGQLQIPAAPLPPYRVDGSDWMRIEHRR